MARWAVLAALLAGHFCQAQGQTARDQARLQDLSFVTTQLPKLHANFFFQLAPAPFAHAAIRGQPGAVENRDFSVNNQANPTAAGSVIQIFATGYGPLEAPGAAPVS